MSETNETEDKTARGGRKMTLNVRRTVESGHVRQSFSHGRSKSVWSRRRSAGRSARARRRSSSRRPAAEARTTRGRGRPAKPKPEEPQSAASGVVLRQLSDDEKDARTRALIDSRQREAEERAQGRAGRRGRSSVTEDQRTKEREEADERKLKEDAATRGRG